MLATEFANVRMQCNTLWQKAAIGVPYRGIESNSGQLLCLLIYRKTNTLQRQCLASHLSKSIINTVSLEPSSINFL